MQKLLKGHVKKCSHYLFYLSLCRLASLFFLTDYSFANEISNGTVICTFKRNCLYFRDTKCCKCMEIRTRKGFFFS